VLQLMVADFDALVCDTIARGLEEFCAGRVLCTYTGRAALEAMDSTLLDAAVLEADLPGMSGFELAERAADRNIPVLLIPGHPDAVALCERHGYQYLPKPFSCDTLARETLRIIRRAKENVDQVRLSGDTFFADLAETSWTTRHLVTQPAEMQALRTATIGRETRMGHLHSPVAGWAQ
jgi:DNA-binding response OmpR family regulator